jgi:hypothetical protein
MSTQLEETINELRSHHRFRRFAMAGQMRNDRSLEAFVRGQLGFDTRMEEKDRKRLSEAATKEIEKARSGDDTLLPVIQATTASDQARLPFDNMRKERERAMRALAKQLPAWPWVDSVHGFGELGFATVVAEAAAVRAPLALSNYPKPDHLWSRLGFAPYDGHAGSTWKRGKTEGWAPRALSKDEWIAHPFNSQRYALIFQVGLWLVNGQAKDGGRYRSKYLERRERTAAAHPDWSKMHSHMDGIRIATKQLLYDLWWEWRRALA